MRSGLLGFVCGATVAGTGMLALPDLLEVDFRGQWRDGRVAELVIVDAGQPDFRRAVIRFGGETVFGTHISIDAFGMYVERKESLGFLPSRFDIQAPDTERAMAATERLCPIVVLATPDEIRISPCLARVGAR